MNSACKAKAQLALISINMKVIPPKPRVLSGVASFLFCTLTVWADSPLTQVGAIIIDPTNAVNVELLLKGPAYPEAPTGEFGLSLTYHDASIGTGVFSLLRADGKFQWQFGYGTSERLAMRLGNNHTLSLFDPEEGADLEPEANIVLDPTEGIAKITIEGLQVATLPTGVSGFVPLGSSGLTVTESGAIGIGNTAPTQKLEVAGNISATDGGNGSALLGNYSGYAGLWLGGNALSTNQSITNYAFLNDPGAGNIVNTPSGQYLDFRVGNSSKMYVKSNGNVGIGTTSPSEKLEVEGGIKTHYFSAQSQNINFSPGAQALNGNGGRVNFDWDDGGSWRVWSDPYGNVITETPAHFYFRCGGNVHFQGFSGFVAMTDTLNVTAPTNSYKGLEVFGYSQNQTGNLLDIWSHNGGAQLFTVKSTGNVGIGAPSPVAKLHVVGEVRLEGAVEVTGSMRIPRQGDIQMGEFGNP